MKKTVKNSIVLIAILLCVVFVCMIFANLIQRDFGKVDVSISSFDNDLGSITYKLYVPKGVSKDNKAPAVLLLHGYQNDKETSGAYAIELARRGYVVMAIDEYGHGSTNISMIERGYVNQKVSVIYGEESKEDGTFVDVGGTKRYRLLMNFSNLSFFNDKYTKDSEGNSVKDSSMGGISAYAYLASMDMVDSTKMCISGHSMGTWASWTVAAAYAGAKDSKGNDITPKATVLQCGELFRKSVYDSDKIYFNNVLLLNAKYEEFSYFRDYKFVVDDKLMASPLRLEFLGTTGQGEWNKTYGSFADGSARRIQKVLTNHRLTTHNSKGMAVALDWFDSATNHKSSIPSNKQVYLAKEYLVFIAMLSGIAMLLPLANLVLEIPFFKTVVVGVPTRENRIKRGWKWWKGAIITILVAGATYPFMTQLGHALMPLPETSVFRMTIGNGFLAWYALLILVSLATTIIPFKKSKKTDSPIDYYDLGLAGESTKDKLDWKLLGKGGLVALICLAIFYILVTICQSIFLLDFRFIWPFFKSFTWTRFGQFLAYIPIFALFFILNNSKIFAGMIMDETSKEGFTNFIKCWWRYALLMIGGVLLLVLLEYVPFFMNIGPGADLLFGSTFGGPFMSLMIVFVPQVLVFSVICTYMYRKTGNVYVGAFMVSALACWIVTGGSAML